ncbi:C45 family peptidase [Microvirga sp. ACRRW]|uniref:C45 family autoproteolytic acyltransferase/hydolase n=1 Tax=Microvirga sp. ACRRW TaxID=2918205 RepID=UPI001EF591AD|nr:C45 family peptidase [Microvirga sp. ACRRW]MCG7393389.1 C45 family peptidase [Microvirga sp. ACRRW]
MTQIRCITIQGTPIERGLSYGHQAEDLIGKAVAHYQRDFAVKGVIWSEALNIAKRFIDIVQNYDPDLATELEGIARGSGQSAEAIMLLNARTEVLFWHEKERGKAQSGTAEECSSAVALPAATRDGVLIHAQNWDWMPGVADHTLAMRVRGQNNPDALHFVEAGQLARHGFNGAGITVTAMGLHSDKDYGRLGVPSPFIRRKVLESQTLAEAIGRVLQGGTSFSHALILSHGSGEALCLETTPDDAFWIEPEDGILVHTNHFKAPAALVKVREANLVRCPDSLTRDMRLRGSLHAACGRITVDDVKAAFADDWGHPYGVLRHPAPRPGGLTSATVYTLIMTPQKGKAWVALKPYENGSFVELDLYAA